MAGRLVIFILIAGLLGGAVAPADDGPAPAPTGAITGQVVDRHGRPLAGAEVWAVQFRKTTATARTDADGRFRLAELKDDKPVDVWAEAEGLARERRDGVRVIPGADRAIPPLNLLPGTRMTGRLVDAQGRPVAGVKVSLKDYRHVLGHTISNEQTEWSLTSDADGRFATPPLPAGSAAFVFAAPGKVRTQAGGKAEPGTPAVDLGEIVLADEVPLRGRVVDQQGRPAPGVGVIVDYDYHNTAKTDADGCFLVHGVGSDAKAIRLDSNAYFAPQPYEIGPDRDDLTLTVIKAYTIHGKAVDAETGEPVPLDTVRLCTVVREADGSYSLRG